MALKAMGESVVVAALVGSHGVGLKKLGEVLDGLDEVDRDRMGRLVVVSRNSVTEGWGSGSRMADVVPTTLLRCSLVTSTIWKAVSQQLSTMQIQPTSMP